MKKSLMKTSAPFFAIALLTAGCSTLSESKQREWDRMTDNTLAKVVLAHPGMQAELGMCAGYLAVERSGSGIPMVGKRGNGVLTASRTGERSYVRITELEVDGAWGVGDYSGLMMIRDAEMFKQACSTGLERENQGVIYIFTKNEPIASYDIKKITIVPRNH